ncbi:MAG: DUF86 domain-containing protein [Anaerolineae bacterium]|nr:DUF86 domain-containing protein [Anaerolineae bacterium]
MLDEVRHVSTFIHEQTRSDLDTNLMLAYAVVRAIEVIGEAAARVTEETRNTYPNILWKNIIGMRNRIVHNYNNVNLDIVWQVASENLPQLELQLVAILTNSE